MNKLNLAGKWSLARAGEKTICTMNVPGTVLSGLLDAKIIEDPFYRINEDRTRELFWNDYQMERSFEVEEGFGKEEQIELVCEGLDTLTDIYLNGTKVASTDNMHRTWKIPVKDALKTGENSIRIVFHSVLKYINDYVYEPGKEVKYIPSGCMKGNHLIRKAHSMFGWDWGPQTIDAGIFRPIYLEGYSHARIEDVDITQDHEQGVKVKAAVRVKEAEDQQSWIRVTICEEDGSGVQLQQIPAADGFAELEFEIPDPKLWWPNGYGSQPLYLVKTELLDQENGQVLEVNEKWIGLRTLTVSQEKDAWGKEFAFCVNGLKIFTRGGNYIPDDCLYTRISIQKQDYLLECCKRANFNCVRVWGGGYYPSDEFYDLCDRKGLIVWQDLMYACNVYDVTDEFAENCRIEAIENVKRLRHHACLGLWCGNNEIESAWDHWGDFQVETAYLRADYIKLFESVLPKAVKETDPDTFYWPSSPSSGGCFDKPDDDTRGDNHYWDVWHGQKPFTDYQKYYFRFCSEFGFQSFPCMKTVNSYTEENDRNIFSRVMESHQKNDAANGKMLYYLSENFQYPENLKQLVYVTQVLQGMAIKYGVDHWRRNRGRCMGALYWQINDNWPVASWSSIDFYGRWKALHYMAAKFYAPVAISVYLTEKNAAVYLENETNQVQNVKVSLRVKDMYCHVIEEITSEGKADAFSAADILDMEISGWKEKKHAVFLEAEAVLADGTVLTDVETLVPFKHLELEIPQFTTKVTEEEADYVIGITSSCFAPFVELDFEDADVIFEDNFFHITDTVEKTIRIKKTDIRSGSFTDACDMSNRLTIRSLRTSD